MNDCIFCKIANGDIESAKVYEDDSIIAFLDNRPINYGATIIMPKHHENHFMNLDNKTSNHLMNIAKEISKSMMNNLPKTPERIGYTIVGYGVEHAHCLILPMYEMFEVTSSRYAYIENSKVKFSIDQVEESPIEERYKTAQLIQI